MMRNEERKIICRTKNDKFHSHFHHEMNCPNLNNQILDNNIKKKNLINLNFLSLKLTLENLSSHD